MRTLLALAAVLCLASPPGPFLRIYNPREPGRVILRDLAVRDGKMYSHRFERLQPEKQLQGRGRERGRQFPCHSQLQDFYRKNRCR